MAEKHSTTLWQKDVTPNEKVSTFTVGKDKEFDVYLAKADVLGNLAHTRMLESIGLLTKDELDAVQAELKNIYKDVLNGKFKIEDHVEVMNEQGCSERVGVKSCLFQVLYCGGYSAGDPPLPVNPLLLCLTSM